MSTNPLLSCRSQRAGLPRAPRRCSAWVRLHGAARSLGWVLAAALACSAGAHAQTSVSPSPGLWNLWRTDSAATPKRPPDLTICVDATGARDPALLMGEAPGDASCQMRGTRRTDPLALEATLNCPTASVLKMAVRFSSGEAFVTRLEPIAGRERGAPARFVHAQREAGCTR